MKREDRLAHIVTAMTLSAILAVVIGATSCSNSNRPQLRKVHTEHLGQLTGTILNRTRDIGITGTDLGISFMEAGTTQRLIFLFGDSWTPDGNGRDKDSAAWTLPFVIPDRNRMPKMNWFTGKQFTEIKIPQLLRYS